MSCSRGKASPNPHTKIKLFADSGGYCQNPGCNINLFLSIGNTDFHIAEMAHIISAGNSGPRSDLTISKDLKGEFSNLILLCPNCHTKIDKAESEFPEEKILNWKETHSEKIKLIFNIKKHENRIDVRRSIIPLLNENKTIFKTYGPLTEQRFNPESEIPKIWLSKIQQKILPNNRKILSTIEVNYDLLNEIEMETFELFRQHLLDFEAKHINNEEINALQFPQELNNIFKN
ncbi:hypothetical protein B0A79_01945 [Flavobacterium piscis]|uniref:HNH endonuclease n=1 Tax=Flavobacterium piscis TaxID=1114874 RepID=A0ABX2XVX7_9FLAO|nr:hypothetical protein [Flavobacterium piscis]OCB77160.1 hypothetical protein FLP_04250 [Flavobacterium piscis]OXG07793.1 hypothetical protein B0A79_01945 [Flavobacterium piscis]